MFESKVNPKSMVKQGNLAQLESKNSRLRRGVRYEPYVALSKKDKKQQKTRQKDEEQRRKQINIQKMSETEKRNPQDKNELETRTSQQQQNLVKLGRGQVPFKKTCFEQMLKMPNFVLPSKGNVISGFLGHSSVCFERPIVQGSFYVELKILEDSDEPKMITYPSSVRIGVCPSSYSMNLPLGGKNSFGWKSADGKVLADNTLIQKIESYDRSDIVGMGIRMYPPYKHPEKGTSFPRGVIYFYKNGKLLFHTEIKKHDDYCVCVSVFNYARVKLFYRKHQVKFLPEKFFPFGEYLDNDSENYKDNNC